MQNAEPRRPDVTPVLAELYWLHIHYGTQFKTILITFKITTQSRLHCMVPELLIPYFSPRPLRSGIQWLKVLGLKQRGEDAFTVLVPTVWNKRPLTI